MVVRWLLDGWMLVGCYSKCACSLIVKYCRCKVVARWMLGCFYVVSCLVVGKWLLGDCWLAKDKRTHPQSLGCSECTVNVSLVPHSVYVYCFFALFCICQVTIKAHIILTDWNLCKQCWQRQRVIVLFSYYQNIMLKNLILSVKVSSETVERRRSLMHHRLSKASWISLKASVILTDLKSRLQTSAVWTEASLVRLQLKRIKCYFKSYDVIFHSGCTSSTSWRVFWVIRWRCEGLSVWWSVDVNYDTVCKCRL